jgi:hypothetical protein
MGSGSSTRQDSPAHVQENWMDLVLGAAADPDMTAFRAASRLAPRLPLRPPKIPAIHGQ